MSQKVKKFKSDERYYADKEYISNSMLNDFRKCPMYYKLKHVDKTWVDPERDYYDFGRAVDTIITQGEKAFKEKFEVVARRSKDSEKTQLTNSVATKVESCISELNRQPYFKRLNFNDKMVSSQEGVGIELNGVKVKFKPDYLNLYTGVLADLKTTASLASFNPQMYAGQLAWYKMIVEAVWSAKVDCFIYAVDKTELNRSHVFSLSKQTLDLAHQENLEALSALTKCLKTGDFIPENFAYDGFHNCPAYSICPLAIQKQVTII